jgi:hypothetical protein
MHEDQWVHNSPFERNVVMDKEEIWVVSHVDPDGVERSNLFRSNGMVHPSYWSPASTPSAPKHLPRIKSHGTKTVAYGHVGSCKVVKHVVKTFRLIDFGRSQLTDSEGDGDPAREAERIRVLQGFKAGSL